MGGLISRGIAATPPIALTGIQANNTTPVLAVTGSIRAPQGQDIPQGQGILPHLTGTGLHITIKNLSTGKIATAMTDDQRVGYQLTFVDIETGHAAQIGDILQITAQSPDPRIRVHPLHHTITTEDINRSHIQLSELIPYKIPTNTELLHNYPNPFNPETWIPYRLAKDANVTLTIYDRSGGIIRNIHVGHQLAAIYESRAKAIHWNGRNELGEQVASGIYFYHLSAGNLLRHPQDGHPQVTLLDTPWVGNPQNPTVGGDDPMGRKPFLTSPRGCKIPFPPFLTHPMGRKSAKSPVGGEIPSPPFLTRISGWKSAKSHHVWG